jgi:phosphoribosylformylglycinamidine (FGAM) synthase-like amidotransferase family enzyme
MDGELQCLAKAGLQLDEPLTVKFTRSETNLFVCRDYEVDVEREADVFNMFIRIRDIHQVF